MKFLKWKKEGLVSSFFIVYLFCSKNKLIFHPAKKHF